MHSSPGQIPGLDPPGSVAVGSRVAAAAAICPLRVLAHAGVF